MQKILVSSLLLAMSLGILPGLVLAQSPHVVISQIQISKATSKDEFIEIKNLSSGSVDLSDWRLSKKTQSGNEYNLLTTFPDISLPAGGRLTIAHGEYTGDKDLIYATSQSLAAHNTLILYSDAGETVVDMVGWGEVTNFEGTGPTPNPGSGEVLMRRGDDTDDNFVDFALSNQEQIIQEPADNKGQIEEQTDDTVQENSADQDNQSGQEIPAEPDTSEQSGFSATGIIIINELLPNPAGADSAGEWLELKSLDSQTVDLTDWVISDSSRSYVLHPQDFSNLLINPDGFLLINREVSGLALNNTGSETLTLEDKSGKLIETITYQDSQENESWALADNSWHWTTSLTPGWDNVITQPKEESGIKNQESNNESDTNSANPSTEKMTQEQRYKDTEKSNNDEKSINQDYAKIIINELLPNPEGADSAEWIELYNQSQVDLVLTGLKISDSSGEVYELTEGLVAGQGYYLIGRDQSDLALNNNGDEVKLHTPTGELIGSVKYFTSAASGEAYALSESGLWDWTSKPTPGAANVFPRVLGVTQPTSPSPAASASQKRSLKPNFLSNSKTDLAAVKSLAVGSEVTTKGSVTVLPGIFGKTYFYIADNNNGIRIYSAKSDFPELAIGDLIEVSSELSQSNEELRLKITSNEDIRIIESDVLAEPREAELAEIGEALEGALVTIYGDVTSIKAGNIYLDDLSAEARVYIASGTEIDKTIYREGDKLQVTGIVSQTSAGYRVMPRSQEDIELTTGEVAGVADENVLIRDRSDQISPITYILIIGLSGIIIAFIFLAQRYGWLRFFKKNTDPDK